MKKQIYLFIFLFLVSATVRGQDHYLLMAGRKLGNYISRGFVKNIPKNTEKSFTLKKVRSFYKKETGVERIVFDFNSSTLPKVLIYLSSYDKRLMLRMENSQRAKDLTKPIKTKMFSTYKVYSIDGKTLMSELTFKRPKEVDIFYLEKPARIVIDAKVKKKEK